jgi:hypothetical protein
MGLRSTINSAVNNAFKKLSDLVIPVTFEKRVSNSFNFGTGEVNTESLEVLVVEGVLIEEQKRIGDRTSTVQSLIVKKMKNDLTGYTDVKINDIAYKFTVSTSNDFVTVLDVTRGA